MRRAIPAAKESTLPSSKRKVLIIAEYIAPVQAVASIRWTKFAKYLAKNHGCEVTVLTNRKSYGRGVFQSKPYSKDSVMGKDTCWFETVEIPYSWGQFFFNAIYNIGRNALNGLKARSVESSRSAQTGDATSRTLSDRRHAEKKTPLVAGVTLSSNLSEKVFDLVDGWCGRAIRNGGIRASLDYGAYDLVISSFGPLWTHEIAKTIKKSYPDVYWLADFRDPIANTARFDYEEKRGLARLLVADADLVTAVSEGTLDNLYLGCGFKTSVLPNGFDPEDIPCKERIVTDRFRVVYTGTLYSDGARQQDLSPLFHAISKAIAEGYMNRDDVVIEYAGTTSHLFHRFAQKYPRVPVIDHGLLARDEALELQGRASLLVVASWNSLVQTGVLTGKVFEYLGWGIPIVGLCTGDVPYSSLRRLLVDCSAGVCYEEADGETREELTLFIKEQYRRWVETGITYCDHTAKEKAAKYSYPMLARRLVELVGMN